MRLAAALVPVLLLTPRSPRPRRAAAGPRARHGLTRLVRLGSWDAQRVWSIEQNRCGSGDPDRSRNCIDRGHGP